MKKMFKLQIVGIESSNVRTSPVEFNGPFCTNIVIWIIVQKNYLP